MNLDRAEAARRLMAPGLAASLNFSRTLSIKCSSANRCPAACDTARDGAPHGALHEQGTLHMTTRDGLEGRGE